MEQLRKSPSFSGSSSTAKRHYQKEEKAAVNQGLCHD
jgi:hypothetical protein